MKIYIDQFRSNQDKPLDYYIQNIRAGVTKEGIVVVSFETREKYYELDVRMSYVGGNKLKGECIEIAPILYDENWVELDVLDHQDHPDNFFINMVVPCDGSFLRIVTPLKHQYLVSFIPFDLVHNYDCLTDTEIVHLGNEYEN